MLTHKDLKEGDWVKLTSVPNHLKDLVEHHKSNEFQIAGKIISYNGDVSFLLNTQPRSPNSTKLSTFFHKGGTLKFLSDHEKLDVVEIKPDALCPYIKKTKAPEIPLQAKDLFYSAEHSELGVYQVLSIVEDNLTFKTPSNKTITCKYDPIRMKPFEFKVGDRISIKDNHYDFNFYKDQYSPTNEYKVIGVSNRGNLAIAPIDPKVKSKPKPFPDASVYISYVSGDFSHFYVEPSQVSKIIDVEPEKNEAIPAEFEVNIGKEAEEAAFRIGARKISRATKSILVFVLKSQNMKLKHIKLLIQLLDTELGHSAVSMLLGYMLPLLPTQDPKIARLCEEFKIEGIVKAADVVFDSLMNALIPQLVGALQILPQVASDEKIQIKNQIEESDLEESQDDAKKLLTC